AVLTQAAPGTARPAIAHGKNGRIVAVNREPTKNEQRRLEKKPAFFVGPVGSCQKRGTQPASLERTPPCSTTPHVNETFETSQTRVAGGRASALKPSIFQALTDFFTVPHHRANHPVGRRHAKP